MQVDYSAKSVTISVGELADFRTGPGQRLQRRPGRWRTQVGIEWHQEQEKESRQSGEKGRYEVPLKVNWPYKGWLFNIQGRIDQWIEQKHDVLIREIKTTSHELPAETDELVNVYKSYFSQLGTYLALLRQKSEENLNFTGELLFINIYDGIRQHISDDQHCIDLFNTQLEILWSFLENQKKRQKTFKSQTPIIAYQSLREGQETIQESLSKATDTSPIVLFQAPTGFGKTGVALEYSLNQVIQGNYQRILYLTSKGSGQTQVMEQLNQMLPKDAGLSSLQIRKKDELCASPRCICNPEDLRLRVGDRWKNCGLSPYSFLESPTNQPNRFRETGERESICPYELMRATMPYAELWVADVNYLFSPQNRSLFFQQPGFDLSKSLLILDEAHNLPSRVADVFSYQVSHDVVEQLHAELQFANGHPAIRKALEQWLDLLEKIEPSEGLEDYVNYDARDCAETLAAALQHHPLNSKLLPEETLMAIWELSDTNLFFRLEYLERLVWSSKAGLLDLSCLDAPTEIGSILQQSPQVIAMSATLEPQPYFLKQFGLLESKSKPAWVEASTPWRNKAYDSAVDVRVDTRYMSRDRHALTTVETLAHCVQSSSKPVVSFFPSYKYAKTIQKTFENKFPHLTLRLQDRGGSPEQHAQFIEDTLGEADLIFLILGSAFAEGIDHLGGKIDLAVIVGPALPEVNALQKKRMRARKDLGQDAAFKEVYQIPGMQKINQALGRLVRGPGQTARILFHCSRFAQKSYQSLLLADFQTEARIAVTSDLHSWLNQS